MNSKDLYSNKYLLSIAEASKYFGINTTKIRNIIKEYKGLSLYNGNKVMIKRSAFERFIDSIDNI